MYILHYASLRIVTQSAQFISNVISNQPRFKSRFKTFYSKRSLKCEHLYPPHNPPSKINITETQTHQQHQAYHLTSKKRARRRKSPLSATGDNAGWNQGGQTYYQQGGQHKGGYGGQGTGGPTPPQKQQKSKVTPGRSYSNTMKLNNNLSYYY